MKKVIFLLVASVLLVGCANTHLGSVLGKVGTVAGATAGAVIGHQSGHATEGAAIGGSSGLLLGQALGDSIGGVPEKREREAISRQQVVKMLNDGSSAYAVCVRNFRVINEDTTHCRRIKYAAGLEQPPTTGDLRTDQLFGFRR